MICACNYIYYSLIRVCNVTTNDSQEDNLTPGMQQLYAFMVINNCNTTYYVLYIMLFCPKKDYILFYDAEASASGAAVLKGIHVGK